MASKYSITDMLGRVLRAITLGTNLNTPGSVIADSGGFPIKAADTPTQTLTISANAQTQPIRVSGISNVIAVLTGTFSAVTVVFEASINSTNGTDGNWVSIGGVRTAGSASAFETTTGSLSAAPAYGWVFSTAGFDWFRIRSTTWTSGTQTWYVEGSNTSITPFTNSVTLSSSVVDTEITTAAALADAFANPTAGHVAADGFMFNGTTWDRLRNNVIVATGDTGAKTATFNGATQVNYNARGAIITILMGAVTGTTPTCVPQLQWSPDGGTTWLNYGPAMTAITATGNHSFFVYPTNFSQTAGVTPANLTTGAAQTVTINSILPRSWRILYTIGGTTPSFTISSVQVNYVL